MFLIRRLSVFLLALTIVCQAQTLPGLLGGSKGGTTAATSSDSLGRTAPRSSIYHFLEACHDERYVTAARYLDLRRLKPDDRRTQGPELAKQLADLLDRDPEFELDQLSDAPEGNSGDGLAAGFDTLVTLADDHTTETIQLQRVVQQGVGVWLVSADSVARIPRLAALEGESAIEKRLPPILVRTRFLGTPLWAWIALVLAGALLSLLSRWLSRAVLALLAPLLKRYAESLHAYRLQTFVEPLRLLLSVLVFRAVIELIAPSALLRDYLIKLLTLLFVLGAAALVMRIVDAISDRMLTNMDLKERAFSHSVLPLGVRFVKICVFCIAVLFVLAAWGYNTNAILAGVGVGGLAVALAAQKTIENLFGGVSVISDRPVLVGDFCQFGGQVGTVEDIGLRSTRIRTLDRTLVTIPNSSFSSMTLENYSRRDKMWFHPTLHLRRDSTGEQVRDMMDAVTRILRVHPMIEIGAVPLRFTKIGDSSLALDVFAYVKTPSYDEYLNIQSELLLDILRAADEHGVGFAIPLTESLNITIPASAYQKAGYGFHQNGEIREEPLRQG